MQPPMDDLGDWPFPLPSFLTDGRSVGKWSGERFELFQFLGLGQKGK